MCCYRGRGTSLLTSPAGAEQRQAVAAQINYLPLVNIGCDLAALGRDLSLTSQRQDAVTLRTEWDDVRDNQLQHLTKKRNGFKNMHAIDRTSELYNSYKKNQYKFE